MSVPSPAFILTSWGVLATGLISFNVGLFNNPNMVIHEKGLFFTVLMYGLFAAVSVQKSVRDKLEGVPVTSIYFGLSWFSTIISLIILGVSLWYADLQLSEKGFYAMAYLLSLFAAVAVQKNTRDLSEIKRSS